MFIVGFLVGAFAALLFLALCDAGGDDDDNLD